MCVFVIFFYFILFLHSMFVNVPFISLNISITFLSHGILFWREGDPTSGSRLVQLDAGRRSLVFPENGNLSEGGEGGWLSSSGLRNCVYARVLACTSGLGLLVPLRRNTDAIQLPGIVNENIVPTPSTNFWPRGPYISLSYRAMQTAWSNLKVGKVSVSGCCLCSPVSQIEVAAFGSIQNQNSGLS